MDLRAYLSTLDTRQRHQLAQAAGLSAGYLLMLAYGHKRASIKAALAIEAATGGLVKADALFPNASRLLAAAGYVKEAPCTPEPVAPTPPPATTPLPAPSPSPAASEPASSHCCAPKDR